MHNNDLSRLFGSSRSSLVLVLQFKPYSAIKELKWDHVNEAQRKVETRAGYPKTTTDAAMFRVGPHQRTHNRLWLPVCTTADAGAAPLRAPSLCGLFLQLQTLKARNLNVLLQAFIHCGRRLHGRHSPRSLC